MRFRVDRAAVDVDVRTGRLQGTVRPEVGLPDGGCVGQHADHDIGITGRLGRGVKNLADTKLFRALPGPIPEPQIESLLMQPARHRPTHLACAEDRNLHSATPFSA